jgi:hypothetical protein
MVHLHTDREQALIQSAGLGKPVNYFDEFLLKNAENDPISPSSTQSMKASGGKTALQRS